jgi:acetolactate synthase-1/2/3 large subunit
VQRAVEEIERARLPVVVAGSSIWWDQAVEELRALVERASLPVFLNGAARGALPHEHPCLFQHARKLAFERADLVLLVGAPLDFRLGYGAAFRPDARIVQIDVEGAEIGRNRAVHVGIVASSRLALAQIAAGLGAAPDRSAFLAELRAYEGDKAAALERLERDSGTPIHHARLAREISEVAHGAGADPIFVADGGNVVAMAAKSIRLDAPGCWLDPGPLGCLGVGAPFAVAAKLVHPDRPVFVVQGDGAFGLNGFDYETALRFGLPMVVVVGNDAAWGQIRLPQIAMYGEALSPATKLAPVRYDRVVEALGGRGEHVTDPAAIRPALQRALESGTVACVNVMLDPEAPARSGMMGYAV